MPSKDLGDEILAAAVAADEAAASRSIGECIRILQCFECKTTEEFPDFPSTANPNDDATLHYIDEKHGGHSEMPHHRAVHAGFQRQSKLELLERLARQQLAVPKKRDCCERDCAWPERAFAVLPRVFGAWPSRSALRESHLT